jgi:putative hydrolase of the HAD superfamily
VTRPLEAVVLDIDDTVYLERDYVRSGFAAAGDWAREQLGVSGLGERAWSAFVAGRRGDIFDEALVACGVVVDPEVVDALVSVYRTHEPSIALLPDARTCLGDLAARVPIAVITDGPLASQQAKARVLCLGHWADPMLFTDGLGPEWGKPDTRSFAMVQERLGVDPGACAYVADNPVKDFAGPKGLGWTTVRVRRPQGLHQRVPSGDDVDHDVPDLTTLAGLIRP